MIRRLATAGKKASLPSDFRMRQMIRRGRAISYLVAPSHSSDSSHSLHHKNEVVPVFQSREKLRSYRQLSSTPSKSPPNEDLTQLMHQLLSYKSLKAAVVDRKEDFSPNPRFSLPLLADVLQIFRKIPQEIPHGASLQLLDKLLLPTRDIVVTSHALNALLEAVETAFAHTSKSNMKLYPVDALLTQDLLLRLRSIRIYSTTAYTPLEIEHWEKRANVIFNMTLNCFALVASQSWKLEIAKDMVQRAETLLMDVGASPDAATSESLLIRADTISFNTVIMAWSKSTRRPARSVPDQVYASEYKRQQEAAINAAERAEAILKVMIDVSEELPSIKPTSSSFTSAITAWVSVESQKANAHVFNLLLPLMDRLCQAKRGPPIETPTLIMACKTMENHNSAAALKENVDLVLDYARRYQVPVDTLLCNAIMTAFRNVDTDDFPNSTKNTYNMLEFFKSEIKNPDRVSYFLVMGGIRRTVQKTRKRDTFLSGEAVRLLKEAGQMADTRMHNDVIGALMFQPDEAAAFFDSMGDRIDLESCRFLLSSFEHASNDRNHYAQKAEDLLRRMEEISDAKLTVFEYNSVIFAWLARNNISSVDRARSILEGLLTKYRRELEKSLKSTNSAQIAGRPNSTSFISIVSAYSKLGSYHHVEVVEEMLRQMGDMQIAAAQASATERRRYAVVEQNTTVSNQLLHMYAKFSTFQPSYLKKAENLLKRMTNLGPACRPDSFSYSIVLKAYESLEDAIPHVVNLLEIASRDDDSNTMCIRLYNSALNTLSKCGKKGVQKAEEVLMDMHRCNVQPDVYSFTALMRGRISLGTMDGLQKADEILQQAIAAGQVDTYCFDCLIEGYLNLNSLESYRRAEELVSSKEDVAADNHRVVATWKTISQLINRAPTCKDATQHFLNAVERDLPWGNVHIEQGAKFDTVRSVLNCWYAHDDSDIASQQIEKVFRAALKSYVHRGKPELTSYHIGTVLRKLSRCEKMDEAKALLEELYENPKTRSLLCHRSYNLILEGLAKCTARREGAADEAIALLQLMEERFRNGETMAQPNGLSYASCVEAWAMSDHPSWEQHTEDTLKRMKENIPSNDPAFAKSFSLVLKACKQKMSIENARNAACFLYATRVFGDMIGSENSMSSSSFSYMLNIVALSKYQDDRKKEELMKKVMKQCQKTGMVSQAVLDVFVKCVSDSVASSVLMCSPSNVKTLKLSDLLFEWTRNRTVPKPSHGR